MAILGGVHTRTPLRSRHRAVLTVRQAHSCALSGVCSWSSLTSGSDVGSGEEELGSCPPGAPGLPGRGRRAHGSCVTCRCWLG